MRIALACIAAVALLPACDGEDIPGPNDGAPDPRPDTPALLSFSVQPTSITAGQLITPPVQVSVTNAAGHPFTSSTAPVTLSLTSSGTTLNGQTTQVATNGVAVFSDLSITKAASIYFLRATGSNIRETTSTAFAVLPGPAAAIVIYRGDAQLVGTGGTVPQPPAVRVTDRFGNPVAGLNVAFEVTSGGGTVDGAQATTAPNGVAAVASWRLGSSPGRNTLRATTGRLNPVLFTATAVTPGVTASGVLTFTTHQHNLALINPDGTNLRTLTVSTRGENDLDAAWSPDGTRIAFARMADNTSFPLAIHLINADGTNLVRISPAGVLDDTPDWSPDGQRIAFTNQDIQNPTPPGTQVWVMNADGTNRVRLTTLPQGAGWPAWSPSGTIAFATGTGQEGDIYVMDADGSDILRLTSDVGRETNPKWSPDGRRIVYSAGAYPGNSALFIIDADGSNRRQLTSPPQEGWSYSDFSPAWSPDGKWVVFTRNYDCDPFQDNNGPACVPVELRITSSSAGAFASVFLTHGRSANWGE